MPILTAANLESRYPVAGGKKPKEVIWVPPWNDIIHLVDEKTLPEAERLARVRSRIIRMKQSPTPEVAKNICTILTAIDDVQDFCTTTGVAARLLSKVAKPAHILAKGSFTTGAMLNQLNVWNKIPWEKLNGDELLAMVRKKKIDLDTLTPTQLKALKKDLTTKYPDWIKLPEKQKQEFMRKNYKMTRERWGLSLKVKKRQAEIAYGKGTPWGKIKTEVDKRLLRTIPTIGETMEIAQTSDMLSGVGLSLGAVIGLAMDTVFGVAKGAPLKFSEQKISETEIKVLKDIGSTILNLPHETRDAFQQAGNAMIHISYMIATGQDLGVEDTILAAWASGQAYLKTRGKELKDAAIGIAEYTKDWLWTMGPRTPALIREALILEGIDPDREEGFPGVKLKSPATMDEIVSAYTEKCQSVLKYYQAQLTTQVEGEFLQGCLECLATNVADFSLKKGGVITETFTPELMIYTRACDWGLEPPIYATDEKFAAWHAYVMGHMKIRSLDAPTYDILKTAKPLFWPPEEVLGEE